MSLRENLTWKRYAKFYAHFESENTQSVQPKKVAQNSHIKLKDLFFTKT